MQKHWAALGNFLNLKLLRQDYFNVSVPFGRMKSTSGAPAKFPIDKAQITVCNKPVMFKNAISSITKCETVNSKKKKNEMRRFCTKFEANVLESDIGVNKLGFGFIEFFLLRK